MSTRYRRLLSWITALTDVPLIVVAFALAYWVRYDLQWFKTVEEMYYAPYSAYLPITAALTAILLGVFKIEGVYDLSRNRGWLNDTYRILNGTTTGIMVMVFITFFVRPAVYSRLLLAYATILIVVVLSIARMARSFIIRRLQMRGIGISRVLIVGAGEIARKIMAHLMARPDLGYAVVGFVDDNPDKGTGELGPYKGMGGTDRLQEIIAGMDVDEVIITLPWMYHRRILAILNQCEQKMVRARIVPDVFQMRLTRLDIDDLNGIPLLGLHEETISGWKLLMKRSIDFGVALFGLIVFAPLMAIIALTVRLDSPGPILFRQARVGKNGREFTLYKFRSMFDGAETQIEELRTQNEARGPLFKMRADPRRTRIGKLLRKTSLDELPQLYNVLRGDMSLVGPRPPLPCEVSCYQPWQMKRLEVTPGLTGLPQVSGRSNLTFDEMAFLDLYYIENWSPVMDAMILLRTIPQVMFGNGAF